MYRYNPVDQSIVDSRVAEFRDQVKRYKAGTLSDGEFLQLRLRNGLYKQRHAYMLRVAIPYGMLSSDQLRMLGHIARKYDKGYGHFTTRQNIQYNWPELEDVPDLLQDLASVEMHAIQTSGNCVRNTTSDQYAGVAKDELFDPRPTSEMIRQWSTFHPEFNYLPRKFKIAVTGAQDDRTAMRFHDIGVRLIKGPDGGLAYEVWAGGGIGRTPVIAKCVRSHLEKEHLLSYIDAILRVYNLEGDRKNKYKARIKILLRTLGLEAFQARVEEEFEKIKGGPLTLTDADFEKYAAFFEDPPYQSGLPDEVTGPNGDARYAQWLKHNIIEHKQPGYRAVLVSLKSTERPPGDITDAMMEQLADLADEFSFGEIRTTHEQNLVLCDVEAQKVRALYEKLDALELATANHGLITDMICCPGLDFCSLANASSIPIAKDITDRFANSDKLVQLGEVKLKMSGCVNACGHHHVGHIGILGIDKKGVQAYQIMLGGEAGDEASLGKWLGPALSREEVTDAIETIGDVYLAKRKGPDEPFLQAFRRLGQQPFFDAVYGEKS